MSCSVNSGVFNATIPLSGLNGTNGFLLDRN